MSLLFGVGFGGGCWLRRGEAVYLVTGKPKRRVGLGHGVHPGETLLVGVLLGHGVHGGGHLLVTGRAGTGKL